MFYLYAEFVFYAAILLGANISHRLAYIEEKSRQKHQQLVHKPLSICISAYTSFLQNIVKQSYF